MSPARKGTHPERLVELEVHVEQLLTDGLRREETQTEILDEVRALKAEINRYKGFLGGILWVFVVMGAALWHLVGPIYNWIVGLKIGH